MYQVSVYCQRLSLCLSAGFLYNLWWNGLPGFGSRWCHFFYSSQDTIQEFYFAILFLSLYPLSFLSIYTILFSYLSIYHSQFISSCFIFGMILNWIWWWGSSSGVLESMVLPHRWYYSQVHYEPSLQWL